jgi:hypothetical protein
MCIWTFPKLEGRWGPKHRLIYNRVRRAFLGIGMLTSSFNEKGELKSNGRNLKT